MQMDFRLKTLKMKNFRIFDNAELRLDEQLTVLVANNGVGKSSALDAIAVALAELLGAKQSRSTEDRLKLVASDARTIYALPPHEYSSFPVSIRGELMSGHQWSGSLDNAEDPARWEIPSEIASFFSTRSVNGSNSDLPVFAYYGTTRTQASLRVKRAPTLGRVSRAFGYMNSLRGGDSLSELGPWLLQSEFERIRHGSSIWGAALDAVYEAGATVLSRHGVTRISYSMENQDVILDFGRLREDGRTKAIEPVHPGSAVIPMNLASDGYRSVLGLVADLAFRCGILNSHLGGEAAQLTSGIVLIDEIDMHLHPSWQTHVLDDLMRAFPSIQFVVTTHSPFVLSAVRGHQVRSIQQISGESSFSDVADLAEGSRIDVVASELLGAPLRAPGQYADSLRSLSRALEQRDLESAAEYVAEIRAAEGNLDRDGVRLISEFEWRRRQTGPS